MKCTLCNSDKYTIILTTTDIRHHTTDKNFNLIKCNKCGLVSVYPLPAEDEIKEFYKKDYWKKKRNLIAKMFERLIYIEKISRISRYKKMGRILDLGCGAGDFLGYLQKKGWACYGVDVSQIACSIAMEKKLSIYNKELADCSFPDTFFNVIISHHSFNYLQDPCSELREMRRILEDDGILALYMPNIECIQFKINKEKWFGLDVPRQFYHYSPKTIDAMLKKNGFVIVKTIYPLWDSLMDLYHRLTPKLAGNFPNPLYLMALMFSLCLKVLSPNLRGTMGIIAKKSVCQMY